MSFPITLMRKRKPFIPLSSRRIPCLRFTSSWSCILTTFLLLFCFVIQISCEKQKPTGPLSKKKTNSPPTITSVKILPEHPTTENQLSVIIQSRDPDGDLVSYRYEWIRNDKEMAGEGGSMLRSGVLKKGDVVQVRVIPSDGKEEGKPFLSDPVRIANAPPVVQEVWIEPKAPTVKDDLRALQKSFDADGDPIYFTYQWERSGAPMVNERKEVLERGPFKKGETITVTIVPDDREIMGAPKKAVPVTILNSPPVIESSPPVSVEGARYTYHVKVSDPDNDPITFALKSHPKGMRIDAKSGLIEWLIQSEDRGLHDLEIEVSDNEGGKSYQRFTLAIEVK